MEQVLALNWNKVIEILLKKMVLSGLDVLKLKTEMSKHLLTSNSLNQLLVRVHFSAPQASSLSNSSSASGAVCLIYILTSPHNSVWTLQKLQSIQHCLPGCHLHYSLCISALFWCQANKPECCKAPETKAEAVCEITHCSLYSSSLKCCLNV